MKHRQMKTTRFSVSPIWLSAFLVKTDWPRPQVKTDAREDNAFCGGRVAESGTRGHVSPNQESLHDLSRRVADDENCQGEGKVESPLLRQ